MPLENNRCQKGEVDESLDFPCIKRTLPNILFHVNREFTTLLGLNVCARGISHSYFVYLPVTNGLAIEDHTDVLIFY